MDGDPPNYVPVDIMIDIFVSRQPNVGCHISLHYHLKSVCHDNGQRRQQKKQKKQALLSWKMKGESQSTPLAKVHTLSHRKSMSKSIHLHKVHT